jgi:hypothetical protein
MVSSSDPKNEYIQTHIQSILSHFFRSGKGGFCPAGGKSGWLTKKFLKGKKVPGFHKK